MTNCNPNVEGYQFLNSWVFNQSYRAWPHLEFPIETPGNPPFFIRISAYLKYLEFLWNFYSTPLYRLFSQYVLIKHLFAYKKTCECGCVCDHICLTYGFVVDNKCLTSCVKKKSESFITPIYNVVSYFPCITGLKAYWLKLFCLQPNPLNT